MIVCYDIGGSRIRAALSQAPGEVEPLGERATPGRDLAAFLEAMAALAPRGVARAAVSVTGVVDPATGLLRVANIPCLDGRNLADLAAGRLGIPVSVANDADCFALAEATTGAGRGHPTVLGIILGTGIGGGLVVAGRLVQGAGGFAGEWGHGPVLHPGMQVEGVEVPVGVCGCGLRGCLDTLGARGIERMHARLTGEAPGSREIVAGWVAGQEPAARTMRIWLELISGGLAMAANLTGASVVPAGGGLAGEAALVAALDAAVRAKVLRSGAAALVVQAAHRVEPGLIGASLLGHGHG